MSNIIKANSNINPTNTVVFRLDDIAQQAEQCLSDVRSEGDRLKEVAHKEAEAIRQRAEQDGREAALGAAKKVFEEKVSQHLDTLIPALQKGIAEINQSKQVWLAQWEKSAVHVAAAIASRVIRREVEAAPEITVQLIREALELAVGSPMIKVRLHPTDFESLNGEVSRLANELSQLGDAQIVADPAITIGGCRIDTEFGSIDQQFEAQLARIEEELT